MEDFGMDVEYDFDKAGIWGSIATPLIEVFNVRISEKIEVFGTITVEDSKGSLDLFNRGPIGFDSIEAKDTLISLTTPPRNIPACGTVTFLVDLKDKYGNEFIKDSFTLDFMDESSIDYLDKYLIARINGVQGLADIYYTIPVVALAATIDIQLIKDDCDGSSHFDVNGRISAQYGSDYDNSVGEDVNEYYKFILFEKTSKDNCPLQLRHGDYLPLSRSFIITAARSSIVIQLDIQVYNNSDGELQQLHGYKVEAPTRIHGNRDRLIVLNRCTFKIHMYFQREN